MLRWLAGIAAVLLFVTGAVLIFRSGTEAPGLPSPPKPRLAAQLPGQLAPIGEAPAADPKSKEVKRFDRSDKNEDGRITLAELVEPRRKAFAKLDIDADGRLSFEEWAAKSIDKFEGADRDGNKSLTRVEFATTAPKPRPKKAACACA